MDAAVKDFWSDKSPAQLAATMATQEHDSYRAKQSFGDGRNHREVQSGDMSRNATITGGMSEADTEASHERIAEFFKRVRAWQKEQKLGRIDLVDTLSALAVFNDSDADASERMMEFGRTLGIRRNSAVKRIGTFNKHREAIQEIAREVWGLPA